MIERILEHASRSSFDFRRYTCAADPESGDFDEQVALYRSLEAISGVLQPKSVLQLDCGYGYGHSPCFRAATLCA